MTTEISGQKTCILRADEKYDATWYRWAGRGLMKESKQMVFMNGSKD
jgi:hypothetical protein